MLVCIKMNYLPQLILSHSHGPPCKTCKADTPHKAWGISANAVWETIAVVLHQEVHERKRAVNHGCPLLRRQLGIQVLCGMRWSSMVTIHAQVNIAIHATFHVVLVSRFTLAPYWIPQIFSKSSRDAFGGGGKSTKLVEFRRFTS